MFRRAALDRVCQLSGVSAAELQRYRRELKESGLPDVLLQRGAGAAFTRELPQGSLLYLLVRAARPERVVETGVRPGYSTAWMLAALDANGTASSCPWVPAPPPGARPPCRTFRSASSSRPVCAPAGPSPSGTRRIGFGRSSAATHRVDLFFYDNGPDGARARFELRAAWDALSERGILLAHHVDATPAWADFCRLQGLAPQVLDSGPPPLGALGVRTRA